MDGLSNELANGLATVVALAADNLTASPTSPASPSTTLSTWGLSPSSTLDVNITSTEAPGGKSRYSLSEIVVIAILAGSLSIITVVGNSMVMISFKIDKQLQTISNYFLFR